MKIRWILSESEKFTPAWFITDPWWAPDYVHLSRCIEALKIVIEDRRDYSRKDMMPEQRQ